MPKKKPVENAGNATVSWKRKALSVDIGAVIAKMYTRDPMSYLPPKRSSGPNYKRKG